MTGGGKVGVYFERATDLAAPPRARGPSQEIAGADAANVPNDLRIFRYATDVSMPGIAEKYKFKGIQQSSEIGTSHEGVST